MGREIERKFLVVSGAWRALAEPVTIRQGYLLTDPERIVRVRVAGGRGWITVKGLSAGAARSEYEYEIPRADAEEMLDRLCLRPLVEKRRTRIPLDGVVWEVDEFFGLNAGLITVEVELAAADQPITLPAWVGAEVTGEVRFHNSQLLKNPFSAWKSPR